MLDSITFSIFALLKSLASVDGCMITSPAAWPHFQPPLQYQLAKAKYIIYEASGFLQCGGNQNIKYMILSFSSNLVALFASHILGMGKAINIRHPP